MKDEKRGMKKPKFVRSASAITAIREMASFFEAVNGARRVKGLACPDRNAGPESGCDFGTGDFSSSGGFAAALLALSMAAFWRARQAGQIAVGGRAYRTPRLRNLPSSPSPLVFNMVTPRADAHETLKIAHVV